MINEAPIQFEAVDDVPDGGVLCALPALIALGLLRHTRDAFALPKGFYPIETIFLTLAFLALARIRSLESLRYQAPGEWGKLLGLDRIPEVKTLRDKLTVLCGEDGAVQHWSRTLSREWLELTDPTISGVLYIDGHVRVYHGKLTKLPRRHIAREKLCLRGTSDYWVNAMDGQPFFVVTKPVDPGLLTVLREQIVPRLKEEIPNQPSAQELQSNPQRHRFTLVFDRAGYSPDFFKELRNERIAILTYHKFPEADWDRAEFSKTSVTLVRGETLELELAERGVLLSNGLWVREVRRLSEAGHQTSVLSTNYERSIDQIASAMFARWCQENFFKYMLEHYGIDRLIEYGTEPIPATTQVVHPGWRDIDSKVRREASVLSRARAAFGALHLDVEAKSADAERYERRMGERLDAVKQGESRLAELKSERKQIPKHIAIGDLPEQSRFNQLRGAKKHLVDTIKMIAYRAETTLVHIASEKLSRAVHDARSWVQGLFKSSVDLRPDRENKTLVVRVHRQNTDASDDVLEHVCAELTATETVFPGSDLRLIFTPVGSSNFLPGQEF